MSVKEGLHLFFLGEYPEVGLLSHRLGMELLTVFQSHGSNFHCHLHRTGGPAAPRPHPHLALPPGVTYF